MEVTNLSDAMESFKQKYGNYPPSFLIGATNKTEIVQFLSKAYGRCDANAEANALIAMNLSSPQALVYWLSGLSPNASKPITDTTTPRTALYDFDKTRFVDATTGAAWVPTSGTVPGYAPVNGKGKPYYYFAATDYLRHAVGTTPPTGPVPYLIQPWDTNPADGKLTVGAGKEVDLDTSNNNFAKPASYQSLCASPKSFQIISAGLDGDYGTVDTTTAVATGTVKLFAGPNYKIYFKSYPDGAGYDTSGADDDNLTNFSEKPLGDAKP
jgi:hypothetical protein